MFLYYVPQGLSQEKVAQQIGYAFEAITACHKQEVLQGPSGQGPGKITADQSLDRDRVKLDVEKQYWRRIPNSPIYVGMYRGDTLQPSLLQRSEMVQGCGVYLADGTRWQVAHARKFLTTDSDASTIIPFCPLPRTLDLDEETGKWVPTKIAPQYRRLADLAEQYRQASYEAVQKAGEGSAGVITFTFEPIDDLAIAGLQANYRIGPAELAFFDAYDVPCRKRLIAAIMDDATFESWQKKRTDAGPAGSTTFDGADNSTQAETA
jgi:hypothetical protein